MSDEPSAAGPLSGEGAGPAETDRAGDEEAAPGKPATGEIDPSIERRPRQWDPIGKVLGERYEVIEHLGAGGMGDVYRARHVTIDKTVAVKLLSEDLSHRMDIVERFLKEAKSASKINHPNIVDIADFGHTPDGVPYFVMEHLEGEDLAKLIARRGRIPWAEAARYMAQICSALQAAHDKDIIHRDIKPANCLRVELGDGTDAIKVLDFGIAKIVGDQVDPSSLTGTGVVLGTAAYMSPEQAQSAPLDHRTDIYSAGIILYQMLTGHVPFEASGFVGLLTKHVTDDPPSLRKVAPDAGITPAMEAVVRKALAKSKSDRFESAKQLAEAIRAVPVDAAPARSRMPLFAIAAVAVLGIGAVLFLGKDEEPAAPQPVLAKAPVPAEAKPAPKIPEPPPPRVEPKPAEPEDAKEETKQPAEPEPEPEPEAKKPAAKKIPAKHSAAAIKRALARRDKAAKDCGEKHGAFAGTAVKVDIEIDASGKITSARALDPYGGQPLGRCIEKAAAGAKLGPAREGEKLTHTFRM